MWYIINSNELYHHGIKGQKWGVRRYQNPDGTLTEEGKRQYSKGEKSTREERYRLKTEKIKIRNENRQARLMQKQKKADLTEQKRKLRVEKNNDRHDYLMTRREQLKRIAKDDRAALSRKKNFASDKADNKNDISVPSDSRKKIGFSDSLKKKVKVGAGIATGVLVAVGGYQIYKNNKGEIGDKVKNLVDKGRNGYDAVLRKVTGKTQEQIGKEREYRKDLKKVSTFSDSELNKRITRLKTEQALKNITNQQVNSGRTLVSDSMKKVAATALTGIGIYAVSAIAKGKFDREQLGNSIFNGGPKKK